MKLKLLVHFENVDSFFALASHIKFVPFCILNISVTPRPQHYFPRFIYYVTLLEPPIHVYIYEEA